MGLLRSMLTTAYEAVRSTETNGCVKHGGEEFECGRQVAYWRAEEEVEEG